MTTRAPSITAAALILASFMVSSAAEDATPTELARIVKAAAPISVDGVLDEAAWKTATPVAVDYIWGKRDEKAESPRMTAKYLWDDFYLYIGYEVFDTNLVAVADGEPQGPPGRERLPCAVVAEPPAPQVDLAEFFLVFEDDMMFWELHHNASNHFSDLLCIVGHPSWRKATPVMAGAGIYWARNEVIQEEEGYTFESAVALKPRADGKPSTVNDGSDTDSGYIGELRLPWYGIGAPTSARKRIVVEPRTETTPAVTKAGPWKMAGRELSILASVQDGDRADRYHTSSPGLRPGHFFHRGVKEYPRYRIAE